MHNGVGARRSRTTDSRVSCLGWRQWEHVRLASFREGERGWLRLPRGSRGRLSLEKAEQTDGHRPQAQTPESIRRGEPRLVKRRGV